MTTFNQNAVFDLGKQILDNNLKDGLYNINVYEIINNQNIFKFKYNSFLEFAVKVNDDCNSLNTYNDFYFEWEDI